MKAIIKNKGARLGMLVLTTALFFTSCSTTSVADEAEVFEQTQLSAIESEALSILNDHRISLGLSSLEFNQKAYEIATEHASYMIEKGELSHDNFQARATEIAQATDAILVAENVARNYKTPEAALEGWISSPKHKSTLEGDFTHTAISIVQDVNGNNYYTNIFIKKEK